MIEIRANALFWTDLVICYLLYDDENFERFKMWQFFCYAQNTLNGIELCIKMHTHKKKDDEYEKDFFYLHFRHQLDYFHFSAMAVFHPLFNNIQRHIH